jgi:hypothetical protein
MQELLALASRLDIVVRVESLESALSETGGGLCRVLGKPLVLIDASLSLLDRIDVLAGALAHFDVDGLFVSPFVRSRIDRARARAGGEAAPIKR